MEVEIHPGDEYLGSLEPQSLQILTYMKFANVPNSSIVTPSGWRSVWGSCPLLRHGSDGDVFGAEGIIAYHKKQGYNLDQHLKESQNNEIVAYSALLTSRLLPAILYSRWLDGKNYLDFTRNLYAKILHFPFTLFYLSWQYHSVQHLIMRGASQETTVEQRGMELLNKAEECIGLLSARLGDSDYFFGSSPSSLDALMFGYLEVILQTPLPSNNSLYNKLTSCTNLTKFCKRIRADHYPDKKTRVAPANSTAQRPSRPPTTIWRDPALWLSVGVAAVVLGIQGMRVGLFDRFLGQQQLTTHTDDDGDGFEVSTNNTPDIDK